MSSEIKYQPGKGPRRTNAGQPLSVLERLSASHLCLYLLLATWYFGGASITARVALSWWGTIGALVIIAILGDKTLRRQANLKPMKWLWPFGLLNLVVLTGCLVPNFRVLDFGDDHGFVKIEGISAWLPSTAVPVEALHGLWLFDGLYLSCFSLLITVNRRRVARWILGFAAVNALVLAAFGTLQKLGHAKGLFFGRVPSPQPYFFASFVYDNHWGAFCVLMVAIFVGATIRILRRQSTQEFLHSPGTFWLFGLLVVTISVPLSGSRACSILLTVLLTYALGAWLFGTIRRRRQQNESAVLPVAAAIAAAAVAAACVWFVAGESILQRLEKTRLQVTEMQAQAGPNQRQVLYSDTWRMAKDMPVFGWGMNSFPRVFMLYNSQESRADGLPVYFNDAHSDWLQAFAEHGFVGTLLLALAFVVPLLQIRGAQPPGPIPGYLLGGCALVLAYALVEFPFGNPAVVLSWLICFFAALRYTLADSSKGKPAR